MRATSATLLSFVVLAAFLLSAGSAKAVAGGASFTAINSTLNINQDLFFNVSADFPQSVTYNIYLNNISVYNGSFAANYAGYKVVKYNITNQPSGIYTSYVKFSGVAFPFNSNIATTVNPKSDFEFLGYAPVTSVFNKTANLDIRIFNDGNTPLDFTWDLPSVSWVTFSLNYDQKFSLQPSQTESIPMTLTLYDSLAHVINFSFSAAYQSTTVNQTYSTELFSPVVNLSFYGSQLTPGIGNSTIYSVNVRNGDDAPVNATFRFFLNIEDNNFTYLKYYTIEPNTTAVSILLPKSTVNSVDVFYQAANGTVIHSNVYTAPSSSTSQPLFGLLVGSLDYIIIAVVAIVILLFLHYRFSRMGGGANIK